MKVLGLTGCIGSGKSEVARILAAQGAKIIDADLLAREAVSLGSPALAKLRTVFSSEFFLPDGHLNRPQLSQHIFSNPAAKTKLEEVVHPEVRRLFSLNFHKLYDRTSKLPLIYVVPLLLRARANYPELEQIVVVTATEQHCLERIVSRDKCSLEAARLKYNSQVPNSEQLKLADYVITNDSGLDQLKAQVLELYKNLVS